MKEVFSASECFIAIKLDMHAIQDLHLDVNVHTVRQSILKGNFGETRPRVLRDLKPQHVVISGGGHKVCMKDIRIVLCFDVFEGPTVGVVGRRCVWKSCGLSEALAWWLRTFQAYDMRRFPWSRFKVVNATTDDLLGKASIHAESRPSLINVARAGYSAAPTNSFAARPPYLPFLPSSRNKPLDVRAHHTYPSANHPSRSR